MDGYVFFNVDGIYVITMQFCILEVFCDFII